jgi:predicted AAA+ superfamily ATPase
MGSFSWKELGGRFDLDFSLQWGLLPWVQLNRENAADILSSYVHTYIKQEIKEEGIVRSLPPFLRFLAFAGQLNGQLLNAQNISREASVPRSSVDVYFSILLDTLLGHFLPAFRPNVKVREQSHPKFYWFDPGVARAAAGLLFDPVDRLWLGTSLETLVYHELRTFNHVRNKNRGIYYYRTGSGVEIDFVVETRKAQTSSPSQVICIEVKLGERWDRRWEQPMRSLKETGKIRVEKMFGLYTGRRAYHFDGVDVLPIGDFFERLYRGEVF